MQELLVPDTAANRALHTAVRKNDLVGVKRAFAQGASPNAYITSKDLPPGEKPPRLPLLGFVEPQASGETDKPRALAIFREFLAHKVDIKALGESQMSAIHWAARLGDIGLMKEILARGADINAPSSMWGTPLNIAIMPGLRDKEGPEVPLITFLLEHGANPNVLNSLSGLTPLMFTAVANHPKTAALLLKHGADPTLVSKTPTSPPQKRTALQWALSARSAEVTRILRAVSPAMTAFEAALDGNLPRLRKLLDSGTSAQSRDEQGTPLLYLAAQSGSAAVVKLLLERGADPNATTQPQGFGNELPQPGVRGFSPLHAAATYGSVAVIRLLLDHKADINALAGRPDWPDTPLTRAVQSNEVAAVKFLLERGAKISDVLERCVQSAGRMPLRRRGESPTKRRSQDTVLEQQSQIYALLVARVRDPKVLGRALCLALERDQYTLAEDLLRRGADVNTKGHEGEPPVFLLITQLALIPLSPMESRGLTAKEKAERHHEDSLQIKEALHCLDALLARKPNLTATIPPELDWKGGTALAYARYFKLPEVVARLQKAGLKR